LLSSRSKARDAARHCSALVWSVLRKASGMAVSFCSTRSPVQSAVRMRSESISRAIHAVCNSNNGWLAANLV